MNKIFFILLIFSMWSLFSPAPARVYAAGAIEESGDVLRVVIPVVSYGTTFAHDDSVGRRQFYISFLASVAGTQLLKLAIDKERPDGSDSNSFPSAHTADAFHGATFLQKRYGWKYGLPAYLGAGFVGYSRIQADKHEFIDVLAGAFIGVVSNYFTTKSSPVVLTPLLGPKALGLKVGAAW